MRNARIETVTQDQLHCFYSRLDGLSAIAQEDALACHRVIDSIFRQTAVIPIRFPTLVNEEEDLRAFLRKQQAEYTAALARLRGSVQMELLISLSVGAPTPLVISGRAYLEERSHAARALVNAAEAVHERVCQLITGWRIRNWKQRDTLRCYALIERTSVEDFKRQVESVPEAHGVKVAVSGPWPCSEFLE